MKWMDTLIKIEILYQREKKRRIEQRKMTYSYIGDQYKERERTQRGHLEDEGNGTVKLMASQGKVLQTNSAGIYTAVGIEVLKFQ